MIFTKAPLPFRGQKRNYIKQIRQIDFSNKTVIDLFGGSGLLAHTIKQQNPTARVIFNDYDNYQGRLQQIQTTEQLRQDLLISARHISKDSKIDAETKQHMISLIISSGCTDWITLSSWLLFSGNYALSFEKLINQTWYFSVPEKPLNADGYLKGCERISSDFKHVLTDYPIDSIIIADPPYIMTDQTGYKNGSFKLGDAITLFKLIQHRQALYFSSIKSESDALFESFVPMSLQKVCRPKHHHFMSEEYYYLVNWL